MAISYGMDPEYGLLDEKGNAQPAHKVYPYKSKEDRTTRVFRDGFNLEVNPSPSSCRALAVMNLYDNLNVAASMLPKGWSLNTKSWYPIDLSTLEDAPEDVLRFGCDPAFDAYKGEPHFISADPAKLPFRTSGCHLHMGFSPPYVYGGDDGSSEFSYGPYKWITDPRKGLLFIKMCDLYLGLPAACLFGRDQYKRRRLYGRAGEFRPQTYDMEKGVIGLEYRVLGSEMSRSHLLLGWAFGIMRRIADEFETYAAKWDPTIEQDLQTAINTGVGKYRLLKEMQGFYDRKVIRALMLERFRDFELLYGASKDMYTMNPNLRKYSVYQNHNGWGDYVSQVMVKKYNLSVDWNWAATG